MLQIENTIISLDVLEKKFLCDISKCKGACCIHGDSGAPLDDNELTILEDIYPIIKEYLTEEGIKAVEEQGIHLIDSEGDNVTPLVNNKECAYTIVENGITLCAIEKAYNNKKVDFKKPVSCHLYPIRVKKYKDFDGVNYDQWDICKDAAVKGNRLGIPVYIAVKDALIRKYGKDWFDQLDYSYKNIEKIDRLK